MNKINEMFEKIKNLEEILIDYNTSKNKIAYLEKEINNCKNEQLEEEKQSIKLKIKKIEEDLSKIEEDIRKIDLFSKECYTLTDIKILLDFVKEDDVLIKKVLSYLDSLIIPIYLESKHVHNIFENSPKIEGNTFKVIKIHSDLEEFIQIIHKNNNKIFFICENVIKKKLLVDMIGFIPTKIRCYVDSKHLYVLCVEPINKEPTEECFFGEYTPVGVEYINNLNFIVEIINEIFKKNLSRLLLDCNLFYNDLIVTNTFLMHTEYFITDIEEWKLDCAMKEIITLSRKERKWEIINWLDQVSLQKDGIYEEIIKDSTLFMDMNRPEMLPKMISLDFYKVLLCIKIILSCNSKRIRKAEQFVERALLKMMNQSTDGVLIHQFIMFAELTVIVRIIPKSKIIPDLSNLREEIFFLISRKSTELTRSLNESLILLKVYFKEKHYDFMSFVDQFVPQKSKLAFEINFFNLIYSNVCDMILCIKFIDNEKVIDMSRLIRYLLGLSIQVPCGCIEQFKRLESFGFIFESSFEEIMRNRSVLHISKKDLKILLGLLFQSTKEIEKFLDDSIEKHIE